MSNFGCFHQERTIKSLLYLIWPIVICNSMAFGATSINLDFSELPFQSVDGLSYEGVTFDFKIDGADSTEAYYNSFGPGTLTYVDDPSLTGDSAGVLSLNFVIPTSDLDFGLALNTASMLTPGFRVELKTPEMVLLDEIAVDVFPTIGALGFSENRFSYSGVPIGSAVIRFDLEPGSFALDNLSFTPVPEPHTVWLMALIVSPGLWSVHRRIRTPRFCRWSVREAETN